MTELLSTELPEPFKMENVVNHKPDEIESLDKFIVYKGREYEVYTDISRKDEFIILKDESENEWLVLVNCWCLC
jgi:hypothetical protein